MTSSARQVLVAAPSRLHFGLFSLGHSAERQYGGVGVMLQQPGLKLRIASGIASANHSPNDSQSSSPLSVRATQFARRWLEFQANKAGTSPTKLAHLQQELSPLTLQVLSAPPDHVGLGVGTQLGLAVAAGLNAWFHLPAAGALELALSVGRALRSAVGTYGFLSGGLIVEQGRRAGEPISPLDCRIDFPAQWRFLLVRPTAGRGMYGSEESAAMQALPVVPPEVTAALVAEACERMVPAAAMVDFPAFSASLYRYGNLAGNCFSARQGGPYNGPTLTALVELLRSLGSQGVGQSSWGPTLFAVCESQAAAEDLSAKVQSAWSGVELSLQITPAANGGASVLDSSTPHQL